MSFDKEIYVRFQGEYFQGFFSGILLGLRHCYDVLFKKIMANVSFKHH
jgi:hypothetical protein